MNPPVFYILGIVNEVHEKRLAVVENGDLVKGPKRGRKVGQEEARKIR